jgi:hypothetical protein
MYMIYSLKHTYQYTHSVAHTDAMTHAGRPTHAVTRRVVQTARVDRAVALPGRARTKEKGAGRGGAGVVQDRLAGDGAVTVWRGPGVDVGRRGSLGGRGRGAGWQDAGGDTGYAGCGVCWGMLSSGPAARSDTAGWSAGWSEPTLARTRDNVQ